MSIFDRLKTSLASSKQPDVREANEISQTDTLRANAEEDKRQYPDDAENIDQFVRILCSAQNRPSKKRFGQNGAQEPDSSDSFIRIYLPEDRMTAYACILPSGHDKPFSLEAALEELRYEGIIYGIDERYLAYIVQERKYLHIFPVARGAAPENGEDGAITAYYLDKTLISLEVPKGGPVDFETENLVQPIRKGEIICRIKPPTKSKDGIDVTGRVLHGIDGIEIHVPSGENTVLSSDGQLLTARVNGIVFMKDGNYCVSPKIVLTEDIGGSHTPIEYSGDVIIRGNISGGALIRCGGDIIVEGMVYDADITAGRTIRLQKGMKGKGKGRLKAGGQIQSRLLEEVTIDAAGDIYAEVILNCDVVCGSSIYATTGRGMITGGDIKTLHGITAKKIGNLSDCLTTITLGYYYEMGRNIENTEKELADLHTILEKLRRNVSTLKALPNISAEKKEILAQLTEQKNLYLKKELQLTEHLKELKRASYTGASAKVISGEIHPTTKIIQSGSEIVIRELQTNCTVHIQGGSLVLH